MSYRNAYRLAATAALIAAAALLLRGDTYAATSFALVTGILLLMSLLELRDDERRIEAERRRNRLRARATIRKDTRP